MTDAIHIQSGLSSVRGAKARNDDCAVISGKVSFYAIADGIGGAEDGDYISRVGCGAGKLEYEKSGDLAAAFRRANEAAIQTSEWISNPQCGSTLLLAEVRENKIRFVGAGDTAAFRLRSGQFDRITPLGRSGDGVRLESAIGYDRDCASYDCSCTISPGDRYLLCTDGVWETYSALNGEMLIENLGHQSAPSSVAARIVSGAKLLGGTDDATAIVIEVDGARFATRRRREAASKITSWGVPPCRTMSS